MPRATRTEGMLLTTSQQGKTIPAGQTSVGHTVQLDHVAPTRVGRRRPRLSQSAPDEAMAAVRLALTIELSRQANG